MHPPGDMIAGVGVRLSESRQPELANVHHKYLSANLLEAPRASTGAMETSPPVLLAHFKPCSVHSLHRTRLETHTLFRLAVIRHPHQHESVLLHLKRLLRD